MVSDPNAVAGTMVTSCRVYGTFLFRGRGESRIEDEWAPAPAGTA